MRKTKLKQKKGSWKDVLNKCRTTVGKDELDKEPSDRFKNQIMHAEHSPIRSMVYDISIKDLKSWIATHFSRHHVGVEKFITTARTDRTGINRDELRQDNLVDMDYEMNAQACINVARKRLCYQASKETRETMQEMKEEIAKEDPIVAACMVPDCVYRGACHEMNCCGFIKTKEYQKQREEYIKDYAECGRELEAMLMDRTKDMTPEEVDELIEELRRELDERYGQGVSNDIEQEEDELELL